MIYLLRGIIYIAMGFILLFSGDVNYELAELVAYLVFFLLADIGLLLWQRRAVNLLEAGLDLMIVAFLVSGWIDQLDTLGMVLGGWFFFSGLCHISGTKRFGLTTVLVIAVGVVMMLFGLILFFREGLEMPGFMGMTGIFILFPGIVMFIGALIGKG